jgi:hypothetical protein
VNGDVATVLFTAVLALGLAAVCGLPAARGVLTIG